MRTECDDSCTDGDCGLCEFNESLNDYMGQDDHPCNYCANGDDCDTCEWNIGDTDEY